MLHHQRGFVVSWQRLLFLCQRSLCECLCMRVIGLPLCEKHSDANDQQTINTSKNVKNHGLSQILLHSEGIFSCWPSSTTDFRLGTEELRMGPSLNDKGRANFQLMLAPCSGCHGEMPNKTRLHVQAMQHSANCSQLSSSWQQTKKKLRQ